MKDASLPLILRYQSGDQSALCEIVEANKNLVFSLVNKLSRSMNPNAMVECDDLVQSGMLALIRSAQSFDTSSGFLFVTYAFFKVRGAILETRLLSMFGNRKSALAGTPIRYIHMGMYQNYCPSHRRLATRDPEADDCSQYLLKSLTETQRNVIQDHLWKGLSGYEIAESTGLSKSRVYQLLDASFRKMKEVAQ